MEPRNSEASNYHYCINNKHISLILKSITIQTFQQSERIKNTLVVSERSGNKPRGD